MKKEKSLWDYLKQAYLMAKEYFIDSEENYKASFYLVLAIICVATLVGLSAAFSWWWVLFWAAFEAKSIALFLTSLEIFAGISVAYVAVRAAYRYLVGLIKLNWRNWFTKKLYDEYIDKNHSFLEIARASDQLANPAQRIHQDIDYFVDLSVDLSLDFLKSILMLTTFISTLWIIGGSLPLTIMGAHLIIPGYLVWIAITLAIIATYIKHKIGEPMHKLNNQEADVEAAFRSELETIGPAAENIALEKGQTYFKRTLGEKFKAITDNSYEKLKVYTSLAAFDGLYNQFSWIIPYIAAAPIYFIGNIGLGALMQIGFSFQEVNSSFSWFMNSFGQLAWYKTNIDRIMDLRAMIESPPQTSTVKEIQVKSVENSHQIVVQALSLHNPQTGKPIAENLTFTFTEKENVILLGPSGLGKSSIFKVIGGIWQYGRGEISIPEESIHFLSQKPTLPLKTSLKALMSYPKPVDAYTPEQYTTILKELGNMEEFLPRLDEVDNWSPKLSGGQQQKIAFARAFLIRPKWLFLDESTASLDPSSELLIYETLLNKLLPDTTYISIAHRESVIPFHQKAIKLSLDENEQVHLEEQFINVSA